jgi:hypothetical protein
MKVFARKSFLFFMVVFFAAGATVFAFEVKKPAATSASSGTVGTGAAGGDVQQPAVISRDTGTEKASEEIKVTLQVPVMSPLFSSVPIALVNDDLIRMDDLMRTLASSHRERIDAAKQTSKIEYTKILHRLISVRLVIQEAINIGLNELPEFASAVDDFSYQALTSFLKKEITRDAKADPAAVEKRYKDKVIEFKIKSLFFEKEEDAKNMADAIKAGKSFDELAEKAVADKKAKGDKEGNFVQPKDLLPVIAAEVSTMGTGSVSTLIKVQEGKMPGFTILKLEDKRYPENPEARERAEQAVLNEKKSAIWLEYKNKLYEKKVKIREGRLDGLNYESTNKLEQLLTDTRTIADIKGEKPITVGELTEALNIKFFHGVDKAAKNKKFKDEIRAVLFALIDKRVIIKEAQERGLDKSEEYQYRLKDFNNSTLFGLFVEKVVTPKVIVMESDLQAYFQAHKGEYMYPEMIKISALVFKNKRDAESALKALKKGADFNWMRANVSGLMEIADDDPLFLNGRVLSMKAVPEDMRTALAGAHKGNFRLYGDAGSRFCVLSVEDVIPAYQQPYEEVRELISEKVLNEKFTKAMEVWFFKLREAGVVKVYLSETAK